MKNIGIVFIIILLLFSCKQKTDNGEYSKEDENVYTIISYIISHLEKEISSLPPGFPPPTNGGVYNYSTRDSLNSYMYFYKKNTKRKVFALVKDMHLISSNYTFDDCTNIDSSLLQKFHSLKEKKHIEINKIAIQDKDSLIYYNKKFKELPIKGFRDKMDLVFNFSRIAFNKEYNKAIVIVGVSMGHLNGFSILIYLEKEHYHWKIKCEKGLSFS